ncbi:immunity 49 family protein [Streptomyces sp. NPDC024089]|uniref:immunity 49 family protein n=1 Tax=Streptomyces sp. NPDC024089 TaxID=3154328 RepID=UPI0033C38701
MSTRGSACGRSTSTRSPTSQVPCDTVVRRRGRRVRPPLGGRPSDVLARATGAAGETANQALAEALELHKAYWSTPERSGDIAGFLALGPLAIACLAYDAGFPVEVESEYLPVRLLDRSWAGTMPQLGAALRARVRSSAPVPGRPSALFPS